MNLPNALHTHSERFHLEMFEVTRANITTVSLVILKPNGMRSRSDKIRFFISFFKQVVCKQDSDYQSVN